MSLPPERHNRTGSGTPSSFHEHGTLAFPIWDSWFGKLLRRHSQECLLALKGFLFLLLGSPQISATTVLGLLTSSLGSRFCILWEVPCESNLWWFVGVLVAEETVVRERTPRLARSGGPAEADHESSVWGLGAYLGGGPGSTSGRARVRQRREERAARNAAPLVVTTVSARGSADGRTWRQRRRAHTPPTYHPPHPGTRGLRGWSPDSHSSLAEGCSWGERNQPPAWQDPGGWEAALGCPDQRMNNEEDMSEAPTTSVTNPESA